MPSITSLSCIEACFASGSEDWLTRLYAGHFHTRLRQGEEFQKLYFVRQSVPAKKAAKNVKAIPVAMDVVHMLFKTKSKRRG